jgi:octaprenyl-diphosphate synthase
MDDPLRRHCKEKGQKPRPGDREHPGEHHLLHRGPAHAMCEGEMTQIEKRSNYVMPEEDYLKIIHKKTAILFQAACMGGAYLGGADIETVKKIGDYGLKLGLAFQIVDDCLDLVGETETLGKTVGLDISKSDVTLPILYLFQELNEAQRQDLLVRMKANEAGLFAEIQKMAAAKKTVERAMDRARTFGDEALKGLERLKDSPSKESLSDLINHCLDRSK